MSSIRDPIFDADVGNSMIERLDQRFEDGLELILGNVYQKDGRMAGDEEIIDKIDRFVYYADRHDENLDVVLDPTALPGNQERSQRELLQEEELKQEMLANQTLREEMFERAEPAT